MTRNEYDKNTEKMSVGRRVVALEDIENGWGRVPAGTEGTITRKQGGWHITFDLCMFCGVQFKVTKVGPRYVDFVQ